ncbi:MAG: hypothetical protein QXM16_01230, partial [Nitrososphaerota archaeon]
MAETYRINLRKLTFFTVIPAVLVLLSLPLPLWVINLNAPMYAQRWLEVAVIPLTGIHGDVNEVNIVNHYVGLAEIKPEKIPETVYLPPLYGVLTVLTVLTGLLRHKRRAHTLLWLVSLVLVVAIPAYIYNWLYNYTHTIHPGAPVKIEPFDPPFFGFYEIANFKIIGYLGPAFFLPLVAVLLQIPPSIVVKFRRKSEVV